MNKKLVISLIFVGLIGVTLIPIQANSVEGVEIDFVIYLDFPEKQMIADELISAAEECGYIVNVIYVDFNGWVEYAHGTWDYDLLYGPYMSVPKDMDIFWIAYYNVILNSVVAEYDKKWNTMVADLYWMYVDAAMNPDLITEDYMNEMIKIFHKIELRLWAKNYFSVFCHFEVPESFWGPIPTFETEALNYNCLQGRVFHDVDLRLELNEKIDRQVFLDYYNIYTTHDVVEIYHFFQNQILHDMKLPDTYP